MSVMNRDGSKGDMDRLYGSEVKGGGPGLGDDLDIISDALARRTRIPTNGRRWVVRRALAALRDDHQDLETYDRAALMLHRLDQISLKADEFALKAKLVEQVGPQSWAAWLAEPESEVSENVTTPAELPYTERANGIQPPPACVIPPRTDVQDESTPSGPAGLEETTSRVMERYRAYLKADAAAAEETVLPDDHAERLRRAIMGSTYVPTNRPGATSGY